MAENSLLRKTHYLETGCNAFTKRRPKSMPLGFWGEQDILHYLRDYGLPYASIYGDIIDQGEKLGLTGLSGTGCMFCMFGVHLDGPENRFMRMQSTHPKLWRYCIYELGIGRVLNYIGVPYKDMFAEVNHEQNRKD
jgi:3'-phosphoadenosine 5'-phosphosulfate sulfotransferase (PAPS reductase)/FAD synthetase